MMLTKDDHKKFTMLFLNYNPSFCHYRSLSCNSETKDFARLTSHPVQGLTAKTKLFAPLGLTLAAVG